MSPCVLSTESAVLVAVRSTAWRGELWLPGGVVWGSSEMSSNWNHFGNKYIHWKLLNILLLWTNSCSGFRKQNIHDNILPQGISSIYAKWLYKYLQSSLLSDFPSPTYFTVSQDLVTLLWYSKTSLFILQHLFGRSMRREFLYVIRDKFAHVKVAPCHTNHGVITNH